MSASPPPCTSRSKPSTTAGPVYAIDWCKTTAPGQQVRPRSAFRFAIASNTEDFRNRIAIVGLQDERVLVEDDYTEYPDFVTLVETQHGYPATCLQWQPSAAANHAWSSKGTASELLATTGDSLRVWEYTSDGQAMAASYVGRQPSGGGHRLSLKTSLAGVRYYVFFLSVDSSRVYSKAKYRAKEQEHRSQVSHGTRKHLTSSSHRPSTQHAPFGISTHNPPLLSSSHTIARCTTSRGYLGRLTSSCPSEQTAACARSTCGVSSTLLSFTRPLFQRIYPRLQHHHRARLARLLPPSSG